MFALVVLIEVVVFGVVGFVIIFPLALLYHACRVRRRRARRLRKAAP